MGGHGNDHGGDHGGGHAKHEEHEEHEEHVNHEAWVIPYADMLTLLMALFVVLFATSIMDVQKFKALAKSLNQALSGPELKTGVFAASGSSPVPATGYTGGKGTSPQDPQAAQTPTNTLPSVELAQQILNQQAAAAAARKAEADRMASLDAQLTSRAKELGFSDAINVRKESRGLVITVVTDQVLFDSGAADLQTQGEVVLEQVGQVIKGVPNQIAVEGHTDSAPISTARFPSNWELSTARATSVLRFMISRGGLNAVKAAGGGYADQRPLDTNDTAEGRQRNRRVEIVILNENQNAVGSSQVANPVAKSG
ncbi:MAG: flagellar motor protein MotB [Acidimicrobiia bacterium]